MNRALATLEDDLADFYARNGFGPSVGKRPLTVPVYTGCILVPLPNIETRHRFLKYHDLHHLVTEYSVGRIGEGEVSAWELGAGSAFVSPTLGLMNLIALSTGLFLRPGRIWRAFRRGCRSRTLYPAEMRYDLEAGRWPTLLQLRQAILETEPANIPVAFRAVEFLFYCCIALIVHAVIAIPAVVTRFITDITLGYTVFEAIKPKKRDDIF